MQFERITSTSNRIIKEIRELGTKKGRMALNAYILEGLRLVDEALQAGAEIRYFVVSEGVPDSFEKLLEKHPGYTGTMGYRIPDDLFERISETESPQGIMAIASYPLIDLDDSIDRFSRLIILENLQDPGNMGTIIRTADACGMDGILLSKDSVDPYNPKVLRSTMGSIFHLPIIISENLDQAVQNLKQKGIVVIAAHPREAQVCWEAPLKDHFALVIGNEGNGLSENMLNQADLRVLIPMPGKTESLNASVAAAMIMYESMRQRFILS